VSDASHRTHFVRLEQLVNIGGGNKAHYTHILGTLSSPKMQESDKNVQFFS